jgi:hypothetical protein
MADLLILEFSVPQAVEVYNQVNGLLGIDPTTHAGEWPDGLLGHEAGSDGSSIVVVESWQSREAQEEFMSARLGPALRQADMPPPTRVTWLPQVGNWQRASSTTS